MKKCLLFLVYLCSLPTLLFAQSPYPFDLTTPITYGEIKRIKETSYLAELQPDGKFDLKSEALFNHRPNRILNFDNDKVSSIEYYSVESYMYSRQNFKYDALGRLNEMSFEDGGMITTKTNIYTYNSKGQLVKQADKYDKLIAASHVIYEGDKISKIELRFPNGRVEPSYIYSYDSGTVKEKYCLLRLGKNQH